MITLTWVRKRSSSSASDDGSSSKALLPVTRDDDVTLVKDKAKQAKTPVDRLTKAVYVSLLVAVSFMVIIKGLSLLGKESKQTIRKTVNGVWDFAESHKLMERAPAFNLDYQEDYPHFHILEENYEAIREECENLLKTQLDDILDLNNLGQYTKGGVSKAKWKTFFFKLGTFIEENSELAPRTAELLHEIPNLYTAFFSIMEPHQHITPHWGYYKGYLRYHLGVVIPNDNKDKSSYLRVNLDYPQTPDNVHKMHSGSTEADEMLDKGDKYYWHNGEGVMFDDTYLHDAHNGSDEIRVVLFLDVARKLPWYLNLFNKLCLWVAMNEPSVREMREHAIMKL